MHVKKNYYIIILIRKNGLYLNWTSTPHLLSVVNLKYVRNVVTPLKSAQ